MTTEALGVLVTDCRAGQSIQMELDMVPPSVQADLMFAQCMCGSEAWNTALGHRSAVDLCKNELAAGSGRWIWVKFRPSPDRLVSSICALLCVKAALLCCAVGCVLLRPGVRRGCVYTYGNGAVCATCGILELLW